MRGDRRGEGGGGCKRIKGEERCEYASGEVVWVGGQEGLEQQELEVRVASSRAHM
jgi:hypothetical protein